MHESKNGKEGMVTSKHCMQESTKREDFEETVKKRDKGERRS